LNRIRWAVFILFMAFLMTSGACGKKAPPRLAVKTFPARVTNLKEHWEGNDLYLKGDIIGREGDKGIQGCRIYYGRYDPGEAPCDDCPIEFTAFYEFGPEAVREKEFSSVVPEGLETGVYYFKVYLLGEGRAVGPPSNVLKVVVE
jgi:hypothetical protein